MPARRSLADYRSKRNFEVTAEPPPRGPGQRSGPLRFMVHKHSATRLHYDLRLELDGALVCWAIPKGPSANPTERRLAVHVEDHPLDYAGFEGVIPKGQYGSGPSLIWDSGTFSPDEGGATYFDDRDAAERELRRGLQAGKVSVTLRGRKLKGSWALVHTKPATNEWLLLKHRDAAANAEQDVLDDGASVASGLTIDELRAEAGATHIQPVGIDSPATLAGVRPAPLAFVEPMLAASSPLPTRYEGWSFEPKLDGIRAMASIDHGRVTMRSRGGHDITSSYPALIISLAAEPVASCLLDGEIVAIDQHGRPSFELLQRRMNLQEPEQISAADREIPVVYFAFDLLHLDGFDLTGASLADRREMIARVLLPLPRVSQVITIDAAPEQAFEIAVAATSILIQKPTEKQRPERLLVCGKVTSGLHFGSGFVNRRDCIPTSRTCSSAQSRRVESCCSIRRPGPTKTMRLKFRSRKVWKHYMVDRLQNREQSYASLRRSTVHDASGFGLNWGGHRLPMH